MLQLDVVACGNCLKDGGQPCDAELNCLLVGALLFLLKEDLAGLLVVLDGISHGAKDQGKVATELHDLAFSDCAGLLSDELLEILDGHRHLPGLQWRYVLEL